MTPSQTEKPSLPSIKFLLNNDAPCEGDNESDARHQPSPWDASPAPSRHRATGSTSSLPEELQNLSLHAPTSIYARTTNYKDDLALLPTPALHTTPSHSQTTAPSWIHLTEERQRNYLTPFTPSPPPPIQLPFTASRRLPGKGHSRSVSELNYPAENYQPITAAPTQPHISHRRAASTSVVDFGPFTPQEESRAQSCSPRPGSPPSEDNESATGKYACPFCQKKFSRPSSLRIHTYSHTGEKPFMCVQEGCGRRFSVQSNMRRHLRVHRLGRPALESDKK